MENSVDFSKMPADYTFCYISECPQKDQCLRYLAASHQQVKKSQILVVNPSLYTGKGCRFFKDSTPIMVAYGMKDSFLDVKAIHSTEIHKELYDEFGRSSFFTSEMDLSQKKMSLSYLLFNELSTTYLAFPIKTVQIL